MSIPTRPDRGPENTVQRIGEAPGILQKKSGKVRACCAGVPGPLDLERRILLNANNLPGWKNVRFPQMLGNRMGMPTYMENDANCAAWGEFIAGAGRGKRSLVLYTLGTGVGGGIILNGEMWVGASGAAGALGHMIIDPSGPRCPAARRAASSSTPPPARWRRVRPGHLQGLLRRRQERRKEALAVVDWAARGSPRRGQHVIQVLYPDVVVLAGGMALAGDFLLDKVGRA
jgi:glucokinase